MNSQFEKSEINIENKIQISIINNTLSIEKQLPQEAQRYTQSVKNKM